MEIISFRFYGDFAHFRKFYTTSSPLTFPFPPPPTIKGIIGAIMGFDRDNYLIKTKDIKVGVSLDSPVKKTRMGLNIIFTKGSSGKFDPTLNPANKGDANKTLRTQIKAEFLKNPSYIIYVSGDDEFNKTLKNRLQNKQNEYTVYLGISELIADFEYLSSHEGIILKESEKVDSVISTISVESIDIEKIEKNRVEIGKERIPTVMEQDRTVKKYEDVIFDVNGKSIYGKFKNLVKISEDKFIYLW
ncbi:MAG: type I-B CRISPR-associated protein Cas5b [Caldimicrobium thiodismutans]|jgi:CRISPR-associated protein Cas5h